MATLSAQHVRLVKLLPLLVLPLALCALWVNIKELLEKQNVIPVWQASMLLGLVMSLVAIALLVKFLLLLVAEVALCVRSDSIRVLLVKLRVGLV